MEEKKRRVSARFIGFFSKVEKKEPVTVYKVDDDLWYKPFEVSLQLNFTEPCAV